MKQYILMMPDELHRLVRIQLAKDSKTFKDVVLGLLSDYGNSDDLPAEGTTTFNEKEN